MLDNETKRRIDSARDILVGKIPDPKSQVEQITIALVYKFMDDMDEDSRKLGGKATFFKGDYQKCAWHKIFDPQMGGFELVNTYGEAIQKMNQNPNIPQLFRDIFKNAYLPYRDPETLKSFLKIICEFKYDHSERLGDAFEYLLSVLGSQGEAGQFRTPRHIIDFMVETIDPKKGEIILDPACGTAGFLISSYKHILKHNSKNFNSEKDVKAFELHNVDLAEITINNKQYKGDKLSSDDKERLVNNIKGYDISPDMVRLSLVNMYLHEFKNPKIIEYDTLTSEDKWGEYADVILANPPFMSPKGGIRPHKKFSIQSNRSEVLFVDYIAEHLAPQGRACVIVPEGIIFQSQTAHKSLRKMLIEKNYLAGIISLPGGVFNPYSGVKTSILWLDRKLAKKIDTILFVKIESDGFDLGAQRRPIKENDLPEAFRAICAYKEAILGGKKFNSDKWQNVLVIDKKAIIENKEFNFTGERYKPNVFKGKQKWPMVQLGEVCDIYQPETITSKEIKGYGPYKVFGANGVIGFYDKYNHENEEVLVTCRGATCGTVNISEPRSWVTGNAMVVTPKKISSLSKKYLYYLLKTTDLSSTISGSAQPQITRTSLSPFQIPLPTLSAQEEIVAEIEGYQKIIDGARQVVENYKPHIDIDPNWPLVELSQLCDVRDGTHDSPKYVSEGYPLITSKNIKDGTIDFTNVDLISKDDLDKINKRSKVDDGDIIMPMIGTIGNPIVVKVDRPFAIKNVALIKFYKDSKLDRHYLQNILNSDYFNKQYINQASGSTQKFISLGFIRSLKIAVPDMKVQREIVANIEKETEYVDVNKSLIRIFSDKIRTRIAQVWGENK